MRPQWIIRAGDGYLRVAETGANFQHANVALSDSETDAPFLDRELHPRAHAANPAIGVRLGAER